jgi:hypothetical protein
MSPIGLVIWVYGYGLRRPKLRRMALWALATYPVYAWRPAAGLVGTLVVWPLMRRRSAQQAMLRQASLEPKARGGTFCACHLTVE